MPTDFSRGFQTSQTETILFLIVVGIVFVLLVAYQIHRAGSQKKRRKSSPSKTPILRSYNRARRDMIALSMREQRTLDHLAWFLKDPARSDRLRDDERLLIRAARKGLREGIVQEPEVIQLLRRLEVSGDVLNAFDKTSQHISTHSEISISDRNLAIATGEVLLSDERGLRVVLEKGHRAISVGSAVEVVCHNAEGMYRFHSQVLSKEGKRVLLKHSNHVGHVQRRRYRRRKVERAVEITIPGIAQKPLVSRTYDLSIGGGALKNPRKRIAVGTNIDCVIDAGSAAPIIVPGLVLRTSRRGKVLHVHFGPMDEQTRHRLFRKLIQIGEKGR